MASTVEVRQATAADQATIRAMIRRARINPMGLKWPRFVVAVDGDTVVGVAQVKVHKQGSRELASVATAPDRQGGGIASRMIGELLARESGTVYLYCEQKLVRFYERFGFREVADDEVAGDLMGKVRLGRFFTRIASFVMREPIRLAVMRRDAAGASNGLDATGV
jgi:N-acetylglutamate synthase-like GNAT family acetyltransferase